MEALDLMLIGCGMMGLRHIRGYGELERVRPGSVRLTAVCDSRPDAAAAAASEAEKLLGHLPQTYSSLADAVAAQPGTRAADVVTDNRSHDAVVLELLSAGVDVLVEKPLAITVARCDRMIRAANERGRILAVAENNRRDPMNRLVKHVLQSGLVGQPNFLLQSSVSMGRNVVGTPWRHSIATGGLALDVGIHQGYIIEYLLGEIDTVQAASRKVFETRTWRPGGGEQAEVEVESDDVFAATLTFKSGALGTWSIHFAGIPGANWERMVVGSEGIVQGPPDRSGKGVTVRLPGRNLSGEDLVSELPRYELNDMESRLFGPRAGGYSLPGPETDRKLIAAEVADFVDAVREGGQPEVGADLGVRSVAVVYALLESAGAGVPVRLEDVLSGKVCEFQKRVEAALPESGGNP